MTIQARSMRLGRSRGEVPDQAGLLRRDDGDPCARIRGDRGEVRAREQRVDRERDRPEPHRAEEDGRELDSVEEHEEDALLGPDAEPGEPAGGGAYGVEEARVRQRAPLAAQGQPLATALPHVAIEKVLRRVEGLHR